LTSIDALRSGRARAPRSLLRRCSPRILHLADGARGFVPISLLETPSWTTRVLQDCVRKDGESQAAATPRAPFPLQRANKLVRAYRPDEAPKTMTIENETGLVCLGARRGSRERW